MGRPRRSVLPFGNPQLAKPLRKDRSMKIEEDSLTLEKLERRLKQQSRLLKFTVGLLFLTIGVLVMHWLLGLQGRLTLRATEVAVLGDTGAGGPRMHPSGLQVLYFDDPRRASRVSRADLQVGDGGNRATRLLLEESSGDADDGSWRGGLDLHVYAPRKQSGLVMRDFEGQERVRLMVDEDGPKLELLDEEGQVLFQAP
jgi:hypothetical protein